jgi:hypothetical protein
MTLLTRFLREYAVSRAKAEFHGTVLVDEVRILEAALRREKRRRVTRGPVVRHGYSARITPEDSVGWDAGLSISSMNPLISV